MKFEHSTSSGSKVIARLKVFISRSDFKVKVTRSWYGIKGLTTRNTHVKYERPTSSG